MKTAYLALCLFVTLTAPARADPAPRVLMKSAAPLVAISYTPDGQVLASADFSGRVALTEVKSGKTLQSFRYKQPVGTLAFAPNGKLLAVGVGKQIRLLNSKSDMKTAKPVRILNASLPIDDTLQFSSDSRVLLAAESNESPENPQYAVEVWEVDAGKRLRYYRSKYAEDNTAALSPDGKTFIASVDATGKSLFSVATGEKIRELADNFTGDSPPFEVPFIWSFAWSPDGKWIAGTGCYFEAAGHLTLWEAATGKIKWSETFYDCGTALAWSPDSSLIAAGTSYDTTYDEPGKLHRPTGVPIFAAMSGQWQRSVHRVPDELNAVTWSPDGNTLATGSDKAIELWKIRG